MEKVLIVDDSPIQATQLKSILESDYDIRVAQTAQDGLSYASSGDYSLILLDVVMPGMDGFTLLPAYADIENSAVLAKHDKKNSDENISLIVPQSEGKSAEIFIGLDEYIRLLNECGRSL